MKNNFEDMLNSYPPKPEDIKKKESKLGNTLAGQKTSIRNIPIDAVLDLHGCILEEAVKKTNKFITECRKKKHRKVLIIHGKGNHSEKDGVLKKEIRRCLEKNKYTGAVGHADRKNGGSGALWVILRY